MSDARRDLHLANSFHQQLISLPNAPNILTDTEIQKYTGVTRLNFDARVNNNSPPHEKNYKQTRESSLLAFDEKLFHNPGQEYQGYARNMSRKTMERNFYKHLVYMYLNDETLPHINHGVQRPHPLPTPHEILLNNVCTDPFLLAILQPVHQGRPLVILNIDHSYARHPKLQDHQAQKRTYYDPFGCNLAKYAIVTSDKGNILHYTPPQSSKSPSSGDGNHLAFQLANEQNGNLPNILDSLLQPPVQWGISVVCNYDLGYEYNIGQNRGTNLTRREYYSPANPSYNPNCRGFVPTTAGSQVLDHQLRPVPNPHPPGQRQLTALEANCKRLDTIMRWVAECNFGKIKKFKILSEKIIHTNFFDEIGQRLPNYPHIVIFEMILHCVCSLVQENSQQYTRRWLPPLPG